MIIVVPLACKCTCMLPCVMDYEIVEQMLTILPERQ